MNTVVVSTLMETEVGLGNKPCEETTESQPKRNSALGSLICNQLTREKQLLDSSRRLKRSIAALPFIIAGEARASLEVLLEK